MRKNNQECFGKEELVKKSDARAPLWCMARGRDTMETEKREFQSMREMRENAFTMRAANHWKRLHGGHAVSFLRILQDEAG